MRASIGWVLVLVSFWLAAPSLASSNWWTNSTGDSLWSDPGNWFTGAVPTSSDDLFFNPDLSHGSIVVDLGGVAQSAKSIDFEGTTASSVIQFKDGTLVTNFFGSGPGEDLVSINLSTTSSLLNVGSSGNTEFSGIIGGNGVGRNDFGLLASGGVFSGANTYTGMTYINFQVPTVLSGVNGSIAASSGIYMNGGTLELDNRNAANNDRVGDNASVDCLAGTITFDGNSAVATGETIGAVALSGTKLNLNVYSNGAPATLALKSLTRSGVAVLELSLASSAGATPGQALIQNAASLPLVGGAGTAASTNLSILPYAIGAGGSFITYDAGPDGKLGTADDVGLRPLDFSTEYLPTIPAGASSTSNVRIAASQTLPQSSIVNALAINNATLTIPSAQQVQLTSGALSLSGTSTQLAAVTGGAINFGGREALIYADGMSSGGQPEYVLDSQLQNASSITKFGAGTIILTRPSSFAGTLAIQEGMIGSRATGALGTGNIVLGMSQNFGSLPIGIAFEGADQTFSNSISDTVNANTVATLSVAGGIKVAYSGVISTEIQKVGTGTLWLTPSSSLGNQNLQYIVSAGTLRVDTVAPQGQFNVGILGNTSAILGGSGTIYSVAVEPNGMLWPGAAGAAGSDILTVTDLSLGYGKFHTSLNGTMPGVQYDQVDVTGNTEFGSPGSDSAAQLEVSVGYEARPGDQFIIINDATGVAITGNFAGLPEGSTFSADGDQFQITYQGGDGNDVVLTVLSTPEPSAITFATACLAGLLLRRRARGVA